MKVLEGAQPSTTMKSQAGLGGGSLAATQQRGPATPSSPNQQTTKGFNKSGKGMTARPMGATLPVSLLLHVCLPRTTPVHLLLQCKPAGVLCLLRTKNDHLLLQSAVICAHCLVLGIEADLSNTVCIYKKQQVLFWVFDQVHALSDCLDAPKSVQRK